MPAKAFIDTNIVIYALGSSSAKVKLAAPLFMHHPTISTQVLSETANVALKKLALPLSETGKLLAMLEATCRVEVVTPTTLRSALDIAERYGFSPDRCYRYRSRVRDALYGRFTAWAGD